MQSDAVRQGDATNHMRVECNGSDLALSINGELLVQTRDPTYLQGDIALVTISYEAEPTEIHFDDLLVLGQSRARTR